MDTPHRLREATYVRRGPITIGLPSAPRLQRREGHSGLLDELRNRNERSSVSDRDDAREDIPGGL